MNFIRCQKEKIKLRKTLGVDRLEAEYERLRKESNKRKCELCEKSLTEDEEFRCEKCLNEWGFEYPDRI